MKSIFFVGLSSVRVEDVEKDEPFSKNTRSGALIRDIANQSSRPAYFTNAVKCLPLDNGKIRYPIKSEMDACFNNFKIELSEISPRKIILLGRQVSDYLCTKIGAQKVEEKMQDGFSKYKWHNTEILASPHPSHILIYKHKNIARYKKQISKFLSI